MMRSIQWSRDETKYLLDHWFDSDSEISLTIGRSSKSVDRKRSGLRAQFPELPTRHVKWSNWETEILLQNFSLPMSELAPLLSGRSVSQITSQRKNLRRQYGSALPKIERVKKPTQPKPSKSRVGKPAESGAVFCIDLSKIENKVQYDREYSRWWRANNPIKKRNQRLAEPRTFTDVLRENHVRYERKRLGIDSTHDKTLRFTREAASNTGKCWTDSEDKYLMDNWSSLSILEQAVVLKRSYQAVGLRRTVLRKKGLAPE